MNYEFIHNYEFYFFTDFTSNAEYWNDDFEVKDFEVQIVYLLKQIEPLYKQLHAYVRRRLMHYYPDAIERKGPIPAHLLGKCSIEVLYYRIMCLQNV